MWVSLPVGEVPGSSCRDKLKGALRIFIPESLRACGRSALQIRGQPVTYRILGFIAH